MTMMMGVRGTAWFLLLALILQLVSIECRREGHVRGMLKGAPLSLEDGHHARALKMKTELKTESKPMNGKGMMGTIMKEGATTKVKGEKTSDSRMNKGTKGGKGGKGGNGMKGKEKKVKKKKHYDGNMKMIDSKKSMKSMKIGKYNGDAYAEPESEDEGMNGNLSSCDSCN